MLDGTAFCPRYLNLNLLLDKALYCYVFYLLYLDDLVDCRRNGFSSFVILYADNILLLAQSISALQNLLVACERELSWLDMKLNVNKSCCMRIGPRYSVKCCKIISNCGYSLPWVNEIRYLGVNIIQSQMFKCSFDRAKRAFYRSLDAVFDRIGRVASEES